MWLRVPRSEWSKSQRSARSSTKSEIDSTQWIESQKQKSASSATMTVWCVLNQYATCACMQLRSAPGVIPTPRTARAAWSGSLCIPGQPISVWAREFYRNFPPKPISFCQKRVSLAIKNESWIFLLNYGLEMHHRSTVLVNESQRYEHHQYPSKIQTHFVMKYFWKLKNILQNIFSRSPYRD